VKCALESEKHAFYIRTTMMDIRMFLEIAGIFMLNNQRVTNREERDCQGPQKNHLHHDQTVMVH
jgi:hypothetical protein